MSLNKFAKVTSNLEDLDKCTGMKIVLEVCHLEMFPARCSSIKLAIPSDVNWAEDRAGDEANVREHNLALELIKLMYIHTSWFQIAIMRLESYGRNFMLSLLTWYLLICYYLFLFSYFYLLVFTCLFLTNPVLPWLFFKPLHH